MSERGSLLILTLFPKEDRNKGAIIEQYSDIAKHCRGKYTDEITCLEEAYSKSKDLVKLFDKKFPFFDKSVKTTDICCTFAVLYDCLTKIYSILSKNFSKPVDKLERIQVNSIKEMRNLIDQKWTSPKSHIEDAILVPLDKLRSLLLLNDVINFDYEDCLSIIVLINIVCSDIIQILNNSSDSAFLLGRDYCLKVEELVTQNGVAKTVSEAADEMLEEIKELDEDCDGVTEVLTSSSEPRSRKRDKKSKEEKEKKMSEQNDLHDIILASVLDINKEVEAYKKVQNNIQIELPDVDLPAEVKESIKVSIKQNLASHLTPLKAELNKKCLETLTVINQMQEELNKYTEFVKGVQNEYELG